MRRTELRTRRRKKCRACREWFNPPTSMAKACSPRCALEVARAERIKRERRENRQAKQEIKPLSMLCSEAQRDVNRYIVARDLYRGCISCGSNQVTDAGHFIHAGSKYRTSRIRFDHRLIHGQCAPCNRFVGGGNMQGYIDGLKRRYGERYLREIYELKGRADRGELEPLTKDEVREIAAKHRRMLKERKGRRDGAQECCED